MYCSLHNSRFMRHERRTQHLERSAKGVRSARRGKELYALFLSSSCFALRTRFALRAKCRVRLAQLIKVGTHWATSCSNELRRKITPCVQVRRLVAATSYGDTSQREIALCVQEKFGENLCLCNRVLSQQQVAQILSDLIFCDLLRRQRFSQKFSSTHEAICCCDVSLQRVAATCRQVCTDLKGPVMQAKVLQR